MQASEAIKTAKTAHSGGARADLSGANLYGANLTRADLYQADLAGANLTGANLACAKLYGANLTGANLARANLSRADLSRADLAGANLTGANLYGARGGILRLDGLPSGTVTFLPLHSGWKLRIGCWSGTTAELRTMIAGDSWPEAEGDEQDQRRPGLSLLADLCDDHATRHADTLVQVVKLWAPEGVSA